jgi:alginate O-acetyltransferase complex protein AlgI
MLFSSTLFLVVFFPLLLLMVHFARQSGSREVVVYVLLIASFIYYMNWNPPDILIVMASVLLNYFIVTNPRLSPWQKIWSCVVLDAGYLAALKIWLSASGPTVFGEKALLFGMVGLPLGISFITFQQIAFVIDRAEGRDKERSLRDYIFFVMYFPHSICGPIVRHNQLIPQTFRASFLNFSSRFASVGFCYFAIGLSKKVLLADPLTEMNTIFFSASSLYPVEAWMNLFMYSLRIYFDFSAYADMAVGVGYFCGVLLPRNFDSPYKATNIAEFWRLWNITLHKFFKEYLFLRLQRLALFRAHVSLAVIVVMLVSAFWHGVGLGFVVWGAGHAMLLIGYRTVRKHLGFINPDSLGRYGVWLWTWFCRASLFTVVSLLWLPFATNDLSIVAKYVHYLFDWKMFLTVSHLPLADRTQLVFLAIGMTAVLALPNSHQICLGERRKVWPIVWSALLVIACVPKILYRTADPVPFVYFQF